jgi:hypothetical protein
VNRDDDEPSSLAAVAPAELRPLARIAETLLALPVRPYFSVGPPPAPVVEVRYPLALPICERGSVHLVSGEPSRLFRLRSLDHLEHVRTPAGVIFVSTAAPEEWEVLDLLIGDYSQWFGGALPAALLVGVELKSSIAPAGVKVAFRFRARSDRPEPEKFWAVGAEFPEGA